MPNDIKDGEATMANGVGHSWPKNVGILAMDIYFPSTYVDQVCLLLWKLTSCAGGAGAVRRGVGRQVHDWTWSDEDGLLL